MQQMVFAERIGSQVASLTEDVANFLMSKSSRDPYDLYRQIRLQEPVCVLPDAVVLSRYEDVRAVWTNTNDFSMDPHRRGSRFQKVRSALAPTEQAQLDALVDFEAHQMTRSDGDDHRRRRGSVRGAFSAGQIRALEGYIRELAAELTAPLATGATIDLIHALAFRLPLRVIMHVLGLDDRLDDLEQIHIWGGHLAANRSGTRPEMIGHAYRAMTEFRSYVEQLLADRSERQPGDQLVDALIRVKDNDGLSQDELVAMVCHFLFTGHETTTKLIGNGIISLLTYGGGSQWRRLTELPSLAGASTEEVLRYESPTHIAYRVAVRDVEVGGFHVKSGTTVMGLIGSANRDEARFSQADQFLIERTDNAPLTFGVGAHFCLGAHLARLEGRVVFETLATLFPTLKIAPGHSIAWASGSTFRGVSELPVSA
jgi:cytochrome P450